MRFKYASSRLTTVRLLPRATATEIFVYSMQRDVKCEDYNGEEGEEAEHLALLALIVAMPLVLT